MTLTAHIVTCGRLDLLKECYRSAREADAPNIEIVVNGSHSTTRRWLNSLRDDRLRWVEVSERSLSECRNLPLEQGAADIIYYLDDDVVIPPHLFREAERLFAEDPQLAVLGGPNLTPEKSSFRQRVFGALMTSWFAAPMVRRRYGAGYQRESNADERHLIFCNLAVRRSLLPAGLIFQSNMVANQENLFLYRCRRAGLRMRFSPRLAVAHHRRKTVTAFSRQVFFYGFGRGQQAFVAPTSCHPAFWIPALALGTLITATAVSAWSPLIAALALYPLLCAGGALGSRETRALGWRAVAVCSLTPLVHLAYGSGFVSGIAKELSAGLASLFPVVSETTRPCSSVNTRSQ